MCLTDFIDWKYIHSWLVFSTQLVNCCLHGQRNYTCALLPLYLLNLYFPPPPSQSKRKVYANSVGGGGCRGVGGDLNCVVDHILQEFNTLFLTRFRTYNIATPPQTNWPVKTTFRDWCLSSSFVHAYSTAPCFADFYMFLGPRIILQGIECRPLTQAAIKRPFRRVLLVFAGSASN
jgi:hypothetical protein